MWRRWTIVLKTKQYSGTKYTFMRHTENRRPEHYFLRFSLVYAAASYRYSYGDVLVIFSTLFSILNASIVIIIIIFHEVVNSQWKQPNSRWLSSSECVPTRVQRQLVRTTTFVSNLRAISEETKILVWVERGLLSITRSFSKTTVFDMGVPWTSYIRTPMSGNRKNIKYRKKVI